VDAVLRLIVGLLILEVVFLVLQRLWPAVRGGRLRRAGLLTDLTYWFATPLITRPVTTVCTYIALVPLFLLLGISARDGYQGYGPIAAQPAWLQALEMIVLGDFVGYWTHRWFHTGPLWRFHAVHHSSTELDWLSSVRVHPVNDVINHVMQAVVLVSLGFAPGAVAAYLPFLTFYALVVHANLSWSFGPLRLVLSSPTYHRWHHACEPEALNRNFAGLLPLWDALFGTLYLPAGRRATVFGVPGARLPDNFVGLTLYPFRRPSAAA
jgi:sterol desaturase/sphingolipid hydroxylase (fatty acid hydroxylase superfamily)